MESMMNIAQTIATKKMVDELGRNVLAATKISFEELKEVAKTLLGEIEGDVDHIEESMTSLTFEILGTKFSIKMLNTVALSNVRDNEFFRGIELLTDISVKHRYSGRIIFYYKEDRYPHLVLSEMLINEDGNYCFLSSVGWKHESFGFRDKSTFNNEAKGMISKGIEDAFFSIETTWRYETSFVSDTDYLNQGNKIGFR
jgi:hypothetical protein